MEQRTRVPAESDPLNVWLFRYGFLEQGEEIQCLLLYRDQDGM